MSNCEATRIDQFIRNNDIRLTCGEMKLRFSFGDKKIYSTIKISQNIMNMIVGIKFEVQPRILIFCIMFAQKVYILSKKVKPPLNSEYWN